MTDADYLFALKLQEELNNDSVDVENYQPQKKRRRDSDDGDNLNATQNIVNPEWETLDPTPDIYSLFGAFDIKFFQGKLKCVELEWSKKMYSCAGICYQRRNRLGMSIIIRLSEPLLKLRSRRNLIETLLHEMIHAYLFILGIREPNGGHGPNFKRIMTGINKIAGTNITVYHTFHDEVNVYKVHIWRCNGICQHRSPFFGWVRRSYNRTPGPSDQWWARHTESCGGCFEKISGPTPKPKSKKSKTVSNTAQPKINTFLDINKGNGGSFGSGVRTSGGASKTQTITGKKVPLMIPAVPPTSLPHTSSRSDSFVGNLRNVVGFKDLSGGAAGSSRQAKPTFVSGGHILGSTSPSAAASDQSVNQTVRDRWASKFEPPKSPPRSPVEPSIPSSSEVSPPPPNNAQVLSPCPSPIAEESKIVDTKSIKSEIKWEIIDDEISVREVNNEIIDISDSEDTDDFNFQPPNRKSALPKQSSEDRRKSIQNEIVEDGEDEDVIELIDDEFDDDLQNKSLELLTDTNVIDDIFGTDTLMEDFNSINDVIMKDPDNVGNSDREIISCPICKERMSRDSLDDHLDGCIGVRVEINHRKGSQPLPFYRKKPPEARAKRRTVGSTLNPEEERLLLQAGYTANEINRLNMENSHEADEYNKRILKEMTEESTIEPNAERPTVISPLASTSHTEDDFVRALDEQHACPVCNMMVAAVDINVHLDDCLRLCDDDID